MKSTQCRISTRSQRRFVEVWQRPNVATHELTLRFLLTKPFKNLWPFEAGRLARRWGGRHDLGGSSIRR